MSSDNKNKNPQRKRSVKNEEQTAFSSWVRDWNSENKFLAFLFGSNYERFKVGRFLFCLFFSFIFSFLITFEMTLSPNVNLGEVASQTVLAPFDFEVTDEEASQKRKVEEVKQIPIVLDYHPNAYEEKLEGVRNTFFNARRKVQSFDESEAVFSKQNKETFDKEFGYELSTRVFNWLYRNKFSVQIEDQLVSSLEQWSASYLIEESQLRGNNKKDYALVRVIDGAGQALGEEQKLKLDKISKIFSYENLESSLTFRSEFSKYDKKKVAEILRLMKEPNLQLNKALYAKKKAEVEASSIPVVISVKKNQVLLKEGSLVQAQDVLLVQEISKHKTSFKKKMKTLLITFLLSILLLSGLSLLKNKFEFSIEKGKQDLLVLFSISFFGIVVTRLFIFLFEGALYQKFGTKIPVDAIILMAPFAMLFMLTSLLVKSRVLVWLFITYFSIGVSFLSSNQFLFLLVALVGGMASVRSFSACKSRRDFYFSGVLSGVIIGFSAVLVHALNLESFANFEATPFLILFGASILGGFLSSIFTVTFIPLFESVFDVMTDLKLLELSSLSHPLLKDLMVRAPGTYHHCMVVGSMVEAACNEIGVNGLLGKVMAYFHDVGKMEHASYFIENQRKNNNPHDNISPHLSKTIIIAHVKDGVELISKYKLGRDILAGVKEHHGTTLIRYFFNKAQNLSEDPKDVKEEEFRYPGPKPQFKESAILMIADSIEAAARSIDDINPLKIQTLIDKMVDSKFTDGQLNECNINFTELAKIKKVFYRVLVGIYHHRVEYPKDTNTKPQKKAEFKDPKELRTLPLRKKVKEKN